MIPYPHIDPVAVALGPVRVHWYGIMYLIGFAAGWAVARSRAKRPSSTWTALDVDDLIFYCAMGVILGGRIGWCIFYGWPTISQNWLNILRIWDGGMSFHGGMLGVGVAAVLFGRAKKKSVVDVLDFIAPLPGIGLFAGRIGNFINGELWGKPTDLPWAFGVADESGRLIARHPSQLYEAALEGLVLFAILFWFTRARRPRGAALALFLILYGLARFTVEWVRLPDADIGYLAGSWLTMGMLLTTPMILAGVLLMLYSYARAVPSGNMRLARV